MIAHYLYQLGLIHGHSKIQYTLLSMVRSAFLVPRALTPQNLPVGIFEIMQGYIKYGSTFGVSFDLASGAKLTIDRRIGLLMKRG